MNIFNPKKKKKTLLWSNNEQKSQQQQICWLKKQFKAFNTLCLNQKIYKNLVVEQHNGQQQRNNLDLDYFTKPKIPALIILHNDFKFNLHLPNWSWRTTINRWIYNHFGY